MNVNRLKLSAAAVAVAAALAGSYSLGNYFPPLGQAHAAIEPVVQAPAAALPDMVAMKPILTSASAALDKAAAARATARGLRWNFMRVS